ncbi:MAG: dihydrofolate reductase [Luminiphilus sp.]|jgi:dihydrofolate reductase|nr:dihydrofolate reductase [Luminiphilus sp.]
MVLSRSDNEVPVVLVLAAAENGVIGRGDALPWELPDDLQHFKRTTMGRPVIMGRKTFDSVGFPLPGRRNIVMTRDQDWAHAGVLSCHTLDVALQSAFDQALIDGADAVMVVGGAEIYRLALRRTDKVILTRVHGEVQGDVFFDLDLFARWREISSERFEAAGRNSHAFTVETLEPAEAGDK